MMSEHAAVVAHPTVKEVRAAFGRAEDALEQQNLEALMRFYAKAYNHNEGAQLSAVSHEPVAQPPLTFEIR